MALRVHIAETFAPADQDRFESRLDPAVEVTYGDSPPPAVEYDVLVSGRPDEALLSASANLRAVVIPWAGVSRKVRDLLLARPHIAVHNLHHNAAATAEMAVALMLAAAKNLVPLDRALRAGDWRPRFTGDTSLELAGKTVLIAGFGAIGRRVGAACAALGMSVLALKRSATAARREGTIEVHSASSLRALLPRSDVLVICLPLTPETTGLIAAEELDLLPPRAILVNVGRGPIVDEEALYAALATGRLHAAGLDVWYQYPEDEAARSSTLPSRLPFHELDSVVLSPHRAGDNMETEARRTEALAALLNAAARGRPLPNRVDLAAGY